MTIAGAIELRALLWPVISGSGTPDDEIVAIAADAWRLFLQVEHCALAVREAAKRSGWLDWLEPHVHTAVSARVMLERARIGCARKQLRHLGRLAQSLDCRLVVLKGAAGLLAGGPGLDLGDVDVLADTEDARRFAEVLDVEGYRPLGGTTPQHLTTRTPKLGLPVEVHHDLAAFSPDDRERIWTRVSPVPNHGGLWALAPADHVRHVLHHSVVEHPGRRGRFRDIRLIEMAADACSDQDLATVEDWMRHHPACTELGSVWRMVKGIRSGSATRDAFPQVALANYTLYRDPTDNRTEGIGALLPQWVIALLFTGRERRAMWRKMWRRPLAPHALPVVAMIETRVPFVGHTIRLFARVPRYVAAWAWALVVVQRLDRSNREASRREQRSNEVSGP